MVTRFFYVCWIVRIGSFQRFAQFHFQCSSFASDLISWLVRREQTSESDSPAAVHMNESFQELNQWSLFAQKSRLQMGRDTSPPAWMYSYRGSLKRTCRRFMSNYPFRKMIPLWVKQWKWTGPHSKNTSAFYFYSLSKQKHKRRAQRRCSSTQTFLCVGQSDKRERNKEKQKKKKLFWWVSSETNIENVSLFITVVCVVSENRVILWLLQRNRNKPMPGKSLVMKVISSNH